MNQHAILHIPDSAYAHALSETRIVLRLRAAKGDIQQCILFYGNRVHPEHKVRMASLEMIRVASDRLFDYFEADFETVLDRLCYYFWLSDGKEDFFYYSGEFTHKPTTNRTEYFHFPFVRREDIPEVPAWAKDVVMYQIFPDSFATAHRFISCQKGDRMTDDGERCETLLGGTIRGIIENMDYLKDLG